MDIESHLWNKEDGWAKEIGGLSSAQLVLVFGGRDVLEKNALLDEIRAAYPNSDIVGCSTAGEIYDVNVLDEHITLTAINFKNTRVRTESFDVISMDQSRIVGEQLSSALLDNDLAHVLVFSAGLFVNGSELVKGLTQNMPEGVTVTGGMSGDSARFEKTLIFCNGKVSSNQVVAVGLYGDDLEVSYASQGGWDAFGLEREITRSEGNVLYELDGRSALVLYKEYLGDYVNDLPGSALLFPLCIRNKKDEEPLVRTIMAIDEEQQSMTFSGDIPEGCTGQLMKANFDRLVGGAMTAADVSREGMPGKIELAILISCVGRKLVLQQRIEEEVEAVRDSLGDDAVITGFYSYGEISPFNRLAECQLHNQTMTITTLSEK